MHVDIAVFARAPVAGQAKTRLIPMLGAKGAAELQHALMRRSLTTALAADWRTSPRDQNAFAFVLAAAALAVEELAPRRWTALPGRSAARGDERGGARSDHRTAGRDRRLHAAPRERATRTTGGFQRLITS